LRRNACFAGLHDGEFKCEASKVPQVAVMTDFSNQQGVSLQVRGLRKSYDGHEVLKGRQF
jgi:hypothetical protein